MTHDGRVSCIAALLLHLLHLLLILARAEVSKFSAAVQLGLLASGRELPLLLLLPLQPHVALPWQT